MSGTTPGPWHIEEDSSETHGLVVFIRGKSGDLAMLPAGHEPIEHSRCRSDAEYIVRAVNSHEELLEALATARELVRTFLMAGDPDEHTRLRLEIIEKVCHRGLNKAEGRSE